MIQYRRVNLIVVKNGEQRTQGGNTMEKKVNKKKRPVTAFRRLSCVVLSVLMMTGLFVIHTPAAEADDLLLGSVSAKYESKGQPETISTGKGDTGGKSYGVYQFASTYDVPYTFAQWCIDSGNDPAIGQRLKDAYYADGGVYGTGFDATWRAIAAAQSQHFLWLQHGYIKAQYYDPTVSKLLSRYGLDVNARSLTLKNAVWSRAVQHGSSGCLNLFAALYSADPSFVSLDDLTIVTRLYNESGAVVTAPPYSNSQPIRKDNVTNNTLRTLIDTYGLEGKYLKYYSKNSAAVQAGVFQRLRINELNDLIAMYQEENLYAPYYDVYKNTWYFPYVEWVVEHGLMNGVDPHAFAPEMTTYRAMVIVILYRMSGSPTPNTPTTFVDVSPTSYYYDAMSWAQENGVVDGTTPTTAEPERDITRQELITMLYRYANFRGFNTDATADLSGFSDSNLVAEWARQTVQWSVGCGMVAGDDLGLLNPESSARRNELAAMIRRFAEIYQMYPY